MVAQAVATIALGLLGASGVAKLIDPEPTTGAMASARLPSSASISRMLGVAEVVAATLGLVDGGITVAPAMLLYLAFGVFTLSGLRDRIPLQSCGCFGREDTPPTWIHVAYNLVSAVALAVILVVDGSPIDWRMGTVELLLYLGFAVLGVYASYLLMTRLPQLLEETRTS